MQMSQMVLSRRDTIFACKLENKLHAFWCVGVQPYIRTSKPATNTNDGIRQAKNGNAISIHRGGMFDPPRSQDLDVARLHMDKVPVLDERQYLAQEVVDQAADPVDFRDEDLVHLLGGLEPVKMTMHQAAQHDAQQYGDGFQEAVQVVVGSWAVVADRNL